MSGAGSQFVVVGSGMAALGAAHRARAEKLDPVLFDAKSYPGGHTASHKIDGFVFDEGPHVSFTKDERIKSMLLENIGGEYERIDARIDNYWQGYWVTHPVITNLRGLPPDFV